MVAMGLKFCGWVAATKRIWTISQFRGWTLRGGGGIEGRDGLHLHQHYHHATPQEQLGQLNTNLVGRVTVPQSVLHMPNQGRHCTMHMPIPLHALRKTLGQLSPNLEYWVTYMGGYITYKYHISDLKTGHVINFNCACALVTKIWDVVNILLSVNGPISQAWDQSAKYSMRYSKCALHMCNGGLNLPGEKHFGVRNPSFQVNAQWPTPSWGYSMGWVVGSASVTPSSPPPLWVWPL